MGGMTRIRHNISPLRYPGGKAKLAPLVSGLVERNWGTPPVMVEPFAGGAGLGLSLLDAGIITLSGALFSGIPIISVTW